MHRDFVGFQVLCRESRRRWIVLFPDAGWPCPGCDCVHLFAGLPQRDDDELAGLGVGEQVIAFEPGHLAGAGQLLLGKADGAVESLGPGLGCDHAREHHSPSGLRRSGWPAGGSSSGPWPGSPAAVAPSATTNASPNTTRPLSTGP